MKNKEKKAFILTGIITGFINGLFGGGGGMVLIPLFSLIKKYSQKVSHATCLAVILPVSLISAVIQIVNGNFELSVGIPTVIGVLIGGFFGALMLKKIKNDTLTKVFLLVMIVSGVKLLFF